MEKPRGNNTNAIKSINTVAKPMNMWKKDGEHLPTKKKMQTKEIIAKLIRCPYVYIYDYIQLYIINLIAIIIDNDVYKYIYT